MSGFPFVLQRMSDLTPISSVLPPTIIFRIAEVQRIVSVELIIALKFVTQWPLNPEAQIRNLASHREKYKKLSTTPKRELIHAQISP